jgi:hypothetical protein
MLKSNFSRYFKYLFIPFFALGCVLSVVVGVEYSFVSEPVEMMPKYWGSPFVFRKQSLASSLEGFYSVFGLISNVMIWCVLLLWIDKAMRNFFHFVWVKRIYYFILGVSSAWFSLVLIFEFAILRNQFSEDTNYWYFNIDQEAQENAGKYEYQLIIIR